MTMLEEPYGDQGDQRGCPKREGGPKLIRVKSPPIDAIIPFGRSGLVYINGPPRCGRTTRNNTPSEALVFHQTLSTPKQATSGGFRRAHPKGELE